VIVQFFSLSAGGMGRVLQGVNPSSRPSPQQTRGWAMEEAFMIGYVRDGMRIVPDLAKALREPSRRIKLGEPDELVPVESSNPPQGVHVLHRSRYLRLFSWKNGRPATPIDVYHSWHDCSKLFKRGCNCV